MTRLDPLREAAQRLVDVIFAMAADEPFVLPLRGMRAANDVRAALAQPAPALTPTHDPLRAALAEALELREALVTALAVALHEAADPKCEGEPQYSVTQAQAESIADTVMLITRAAQPAPPLVAHHQPSIETSGSYGIDVAWLVCSCGWDQNKSKLGWTGHIALAQPSAPLDEPTR